MRATLFVLLSTAACNPGQWVGYGSGGYTSGGYAGGAPPQGGAQPAAEPPPAPNLVATGAGKSLQRVSADDNANETGPALSRDGKWLLYSLATFETDDNPSTLRVVRSRADGKGATALSKSTASTYSPTWLPNGNAYFAVSNALGSVDIVKSLKVAPNAAMSRVLSGRDLPEVQGVVVSPTGTHVAFHSKVGGVWTIGVARIDGSELTNLVPGAFPSWSPDGTRLVFHQQGNDGWQIYVTDIEGGELTQLTDGNAINEYPAWSPDGKSIAFLSNRGWDRFVDANEGVRNVYVIHADGTGLVALTDGARRMEETSWGSDGRVYFASDDSGTWDIWRVSPDDAAIDAAR